MRRYNYFEILKLIEHISLAHPLVENFYKRRYAINNNHDIIYPALICTTNNFLVGENVSTLNCTLLYVDKETPERDNIDQIQSVGTTNITEIVNVLRNGFDLDIKEQLSFRYFDDDFADKCAGCFTDVKIIMPSDIGDCYWFDVDDYCDNCIKK